MDFAFFSSLLVHTHESCSEIALRSQVLRIIVRLSRRITIQMPFFVCVSRAWFERALNSQKVKTGYQIRKGSESQSKTAFGTWFTPLWTGPIFKMSLIWNKFRVFYLLTLEESSYNPLLFHRFEFKQKKSFYFYFNQMILQKFEKIISSCLSSQIC